MTDLDRLVKILRSVASELEKHSLDDEKWSIDYVWALPNDTVFVTDGDKPEVLVTQMSDELGFLESDIADGGTALPYLLSKVADLLRGAQAAIVVNGPGGE